MDIAIVYMNWWSRNLGLSLPDSNPSYNTLATFIQILCIK